MHDPKYRENIMQKRNSYLVGKTFNKYLLASVLTVAATYIANIVDAMIVGNLIGADALAAVNLSKPILQTIFAISCLYVASSTILTGMAIGKGDREKANMLFTFSIIVSCLLGAGISCAGMWGFDSLSALLCQSDALRPMTNDFTMVTLLSAVPMLLMYTFDQFVTVDGSPKMISRAVIVGNIVNICLDIVFIRYCGWGVKGAAWATFVMYIVCTLMVLPHFRKPNTLRLHLPKMSQIELDKIISLGLPLFFSTVLLSVQYIGNNYVTSTYIGDNGLMALAVCMQLFTFSMIILTGTLRTIQPVGSILKGMDDSQGMIMLMKRAYGFMAISLVFFTAVLVLFPGQIGAMLGVAEGEGQQIVRHALPIFSLHIVMQGLVFNMMPVFQLYGRKQMALFLSIAQTLLPMIIFWLMQGAWIGFFIGQLLTAVILLIWGVAIRRRDKSLSPVLLIPMKGSREVFDSSIAINYVSLSENLHALRTFLQEKGVEGRQLNTTLVCVEEFAKNIIEHGKANSIDVSVTMADNGDDREINITMHDDGMAFNPLELLNATEAKIGLGLQLARAFCKKLDYKYIFNQNMTTIRI